MKPTPLLLLVLLTGCAGTRAQGPSQADEAAIRRAQAQTQAALISGDTLALRSLWHEDLIVNNPLGQVIGRQGVVDRVGQGLIRYRAYESTIERLSVDGDFAFVMGAETVYPTGNAPLAGQTVQRRFTNVWKRTGGAWQMIARHANIVPPR